MTVSIMAGRSGRRLVAACRHFRLRRRRNLGLSGHDRIRTVFGRIFFSPPRTKMPPNRRASRLRSSPLGRPSIRKRRSGTYRHFYPDGSSWRSGQGCGNGLEEGSNAVSPPQVRPAKRSRASHRVQRAAVGASDLANPHHAGACAHATPLVWPRQGNSTRETRESMRGTG